MRRLEENICQDTFDKGLFFTIYKERLKCNDKKTNSKNGQNVWIDISSRRYTDGKEAYGKLLHIIHLKCK